LIGADYTAIVGGLARHAPAGTQKWCDGKPGGFDDSFYASRAGEPRELPKGRCQSCRRVHYPVLVIDGAIGAARHAGADRLRAGRAG
jgi:hypothetical protein